MHLLVDSTQISICDFFQKKLPFSSYFKVTFIIFAIFIPKN